MTWLSDAERPVALVGGSGWARESATQFQSFAEAHSLPVVTAVRQQDLIDNESPVYVGTLGLGTTPGLEAKLADADLLIIVGAMPDALTAKELPALRRDVRAPRLVHVYPDPDGLHHRRRADLAIVSSVGAFVQTLPNRAAGIAATRLAWLESLRLAWQERAWEVADTDISTRYVRALRRALGPDVVVTVGAGNYTAWPQRGWVYREFPSMVGTQAGSMGYGLPAAIAAKLVFPTRRVVAWAGDGCFQMTCQELATLVQYELDVLIIVVNNSCLGTIRMHQEARFPGRPVGTALINPDFAALARSYGVRGFRVFEPAEMEDALDEILAEPGAGLIEIVMGGSPA
jgi:acetolactate synthase-1/2/3 large subunit